MQKGEGGHKINNFGVGTFYIKLQCFSFHKTNPVKFYGVIKWE